MRETITVLVCVAIILIALQTGLIRTGIDYEVIARQAENLQEANERLTDEIKRLVADVSGTSLTVSLTTIETVGGRSSWDARWAELQTHLHKTFASQVKEGMLELVPGKGTILLRLNESFLFNSGSNQVSSRRRSVLLELSGILNGMKDIKIQITGHTDALRNGKDTLVGHSALRESSFRHARKIADLLEAHGVDPVQISVVGCGDYQPLVPNDSAVHRARNRRIEVMLSPGDSELLAAARSLVKISSATRQVSKSPVTEEASSEFVSGEEEALGAEALDANDKNEFDAGYDRPAGN